MRETETRVLPFSNGTQFGDWGERNCQRCQLYNRDRFDGACEIDAAIADAFCGDGSFTAEMGARLGFHQGDNAYTWDCPERVTR